MRGLSRPTLLEGDCTSVAVRLGSTEQGATAGTYVYSIRIVVESA